MGYFWGLFDRKQQAQQQQSLAFIPCAPGCRGSENDPRYCRCVCRGLNHGSLVYQRQVRPIPVPQGFNPYYAVHQEPEALPFLTPALPEIRQPEPVQTPQAKPQKVEGFTLIGRQAKRAFKPVGRSFLTAMTGQRRDEAELNETIFSGLRKQFSEERVNAIVEEAFTEYYSHNPDLNRPELYELYETNLIDHVLDRRGIRWVIGRPKKKRNL